MRTRERQLLLNADDHVVALPAKCREAAGEVEARLLLQVLGLDGHEASDDAADREGQIDDPRS